jgi:hypothetical protein
MHRSCAAIVLTCLCMPQVLGLHPTIHTLLYAQMCWWLQIDSE